MTDLNKCLEKLQQYKQLEEREIKVICEKVKEILIKQPNLKQINAPVTVCGDTHGQFYDLLQLFEIGGKSPNTNYLFLGDYVDRGYNSVQTFSYVLILKILHPDRITLLRGNHQNKQINKLYGFYEQCYKKYGTENVWRMFTEIFLYLPLAALIEKQVNRKLYSSFLYMEVQALQSLGYSRFDKSIGQETYHMMVPCAIYSGLIQHNKQEVIRRHQEELDFHGDLIKLKNLFIQIILR